MMKRLVMLVVLMSAVLASAGCYHYFETPVARPAGLAEAALNERFDALRQRVLNEVPGVRSVSFNRDEQAVPTSIMVVLDGTRKMDEVKAGVHAIMQEMGLESVPVSVLIQGD